MPGVVCEVQANGDMRLLGGAARRLFGAGFTSTGQDWIFARLHVADRPLYLTRLSEARYNNLSSELEVRLRTSSDAADDPNVIQYSQVMVRMVPTGGLLPVDGADIQGRAVLIALAPIVSAQNAEVDADRAEIETFSTEPQLSLDIEIRLQETLMKSA